MGKFEVNILGCGSALPTARHYPSTQILNIRDNLFMIDCGEGAQIQFRRMRLKFTRLGHIFLSHLHGDHCFGLIGMISTFGMIERTADLHIYAHKDLPILMKPQLDFFCKGLPFEVIFHEIDPSERTVVYDDRSLTVETIPLKHRMPTCGFLFREKPVQNHIIRDMIDFYKVPVFMINRIKNGEDYICEDGTVVPNSRLTIPAASPRSYAYCSDTMFYPKIVEQIRNVDLLFHEATFLETEKARAKTTMHSTAKQAAEIAKMAEVKKMIIGHFSARYEDDECLLAEAKDIFANTILANENLSINI